MTTKKFTIDYFIKKFKAIPNKQWTTGQYTDGEGAYCAYGHCGISERFESTPESDALELILGKSVAHINDNIYLNKPLPQRTPKARILAALKDAKKKERGK